ncbi:hypothetical protein [Streptomyces sp. NBC_00197]|uniref:hypothetical protein n=1 Tax=Streptomyces sp. NBC_00197 TaxID=2975676 RepID=UPI00324CF179
MLGQLMRGNGDWCSRQPEVHGGVAPSRRAFAAALRSPGRASLASRSVRLRLAAEMSVLETLGDLRGRYCALCGPGGAPGGILAGATVVHSESALANKLLGDLSKWTVA